MSAERRVLIGVALALVAALYLPLLAAPFEYDDYPEILLNRVLRSPGSVAEMVRYNPFRALLLYTFAWDFWAWGAHPQGYRLLNIAIHAANTVLLSSLLAAVAGRISGDRRVFVATGTLLFAVHPLAIESVTYISGRSSSLATLFVLVSLRAWVARADALQDPATAAVVAAQTRQANLLLAAVAAGLLGIGVPLAAAVASGALGPGRAAAITLGLLGVAATAAAAAFGERWRNLGPDEVPPEVRERVRRSRRLYLVAGAGFLLGVVTKEIAAVLPALLLLLEGTLLGGSWRDGLASLRGRLFPFFAVPLVLIAFRLALYGYLASPTEIRPVADNVATQIHAVTGYLRMLALPYPQSIYHDLATVPWPGTAGTWARAAGLAAAVAALVRGRQHRPALAFGGLLIAVALLPTSSVFPLKESFVEHRTYLPSVGWCVAVAGVLSSLGRPRVVAALGTAALIGYASLHVGYHRLWRSEETLWSHAVVVNPESADAWRYLGDLFLRHERLEDATKALARAVDNRPHDPVLLNKLGLVTAQRGDLVAADGVLARAIAVDPCNNPALNNLALIARQQRDLPRAVELYDRSLGCDPGDITAHKGLGDVYFKDLRDRRRAAEHYQRALERMDPYSPEAADLKKRVLELTW